MTPKNLFDKINADAFYHVSQYKAKYPALGEELYEAFASTDFWGNLKVNHLIDLRIALPNEIWDGNIFSLVMIFQSQMTTNKQPAQ